jgi:hypothetical protein
MLVKGVFTNISGSLGGLTGSRNKGGQYLRARTNGTNPNTTAQQAVRTTFSDANGSWTSLTGAQRSAWNSFASIQSWVNRLGDPIQLSGQQAYVGSYSAMMAAGLTPVTAPPTPNTRPGAYLPTTPELQDDSGEPGFTAASPALGAGDIILIGASPILGPGVTNYHGRYQQIAAAAADAAILVAAAGFAPIITSITGGDRVSLRFRHVTTDGRYSPYSDSIYTAVTL